MTSSKGSDESASAAQLNNNTECCMCGDLGFSDQLIHCKVCQFRSQHRYCSNLYPKDEACETCNWCLSQQKEESNNAKEKSPNSSNSSSSHHKNNNNDEGNNNNKNKQRVIKKLQIQKPIIKKPKSPSDHHHHRSSRSPPSPSPSPSPSVMTPTRKRIVTNGAMEERLRRTKSEGVIASVRNGGATKQVFRNKVRRYKLLDEVSS
ncbi:hypothetical protein PIB30_081159 [Stylosanthes scabra]|uniref:PHD-type zinc finger plants domain-containing protein n=1 Tax=Stylosanthes scabra TaxID=79078 RepID=A0ABU6ZQC3_9FABA|nr:hypothetical protein [Stylosanthes scabra]